ncbi:MAG: hypothetical protein IPM99_07530, partial [Rubrivivax sp.]|nr:hypothetical protein [Rubrivivax sp.]
MTSQVPLRMAGEQVLHLDGLALPPPDADAEAALRTPAVEPAGRARRRCRRRRRDL